jgi:predicted nucleic-acid-binding protein
MRAADTNVLVRLLERDDARQVQAAEDFIAPGAWISHLVLAETLWVLDAVYERSPAQIATAVDMLLDHRHLVLQDADTVAAALAHFRQRPALGFSDCLVVEAARRAGHVPIGTFDRTLARLDSVSLL